MNTKVALFIFAFAAVAGNALSATVEVESRANPIRKVVTMLKAMQKKVTEEGEVETNLYEKFMCYCKNSGGDLDKSIALAEDKVPDVESSISESEAKLAQTKLDLKTAQVDRDAAKETIGKTKELRAKEAGDFAKVESELEANIAALGNAITSLEKGMVGAFIQSTGAQSLRRLVVDREDLSDFDRQMLASFLEAKQGYVPQSGQIVGILKELKDTMSKELAASTSTEEASIKSSGELVAAKEKEIASLTKAIETKTEQIGELGVEIVTLKDDLADTQKALLEDKGFMENLKENCATKTAEHEENMKLRGMELVALADTIKVLNDDDALELFKKTLPSASSASFMQEQVTMASQRERALEVVQSEQRRNTASHSGINFLVLALKSKKVDFTKVIKMIDDMKAILGKEQEDDAHQKSYCESSFDKLEDKAKGLKGDLADLSAQIEHEKESIAALVEEIKALTAGIVALDKSVAEATEDRKEENAEHKELMANDGAAKDVLTYAKNRLNKFYNSDLYVPPEERVLSEEDKLYTTFGGTVDTTPPPGGIAGTGVEVPASFAQVAIHSQRRALNDVAPPPPPETAAAYAKKAEASTGVIYMIDTLIKDLDKEMTESQTAELEAQKDYEKTMAESAEKRATDSALIADKESAKAALSSDLQMHEGESAATTKELVATGEVIAQLHAECDWLLQNFELRKEARAGEVNSLDKAKAVLSGADYSLAQLRSMRHLRH